MQKLILNEKGDVILVTDNGRMENGVTTSEIHGDFVCDAETASRLYSKNKGLCVNFYPPIYNYPIKRDGYCRIFTDNDQMKRNDEIYEENIRQLTSEIETLKDKIQKQNEIYEKNWFVRLFLKKIEV